MTIRFPLLPFALTRVVVLTSVVALPPWTACSARTCPPWTPPQGVAMDAPPRRPPVQKSGAPARGCTDWSAVGGGNARGRRSFCPGLRQPPTVRWRFDTGAAVLASPILRGHSLFVGSTNGRLFALYRATGKPRWTFEAGSPIRAAVALQGDALYLGTRDGQLRRLDAKTGRVRWARPLGAAIEHAPVVHQTVVVVGTTDGRLTALDTRTGLFRWQFVTASTWRPSHKGGYTLAGIGTTPARQGNTLYVGSLGGQVHALCVDSGKLRWRIRTVHAVRSAPVVTPGGLWVSDASGYVHGLSRVNGDRLGTGMRSWYERDISAVTPGDGGLYLATDVTLLGLTPGGAVRWKYRLGWSAARLDRVAHPAPVLASDVVYLNDRYGHLLAVDAAKGKLLWQRRARRGAFSSPAPAREGLFVGSGDGFVYLLANPITPGGDLAPKCAP